MKRDIFDRAILLVVTVATGVSALTHNWTGVVMGAVVALFDIAWTLHDISEQTRPKPAPINITLTGDVSADHILREIRKVNRLRGERP